MKHAVKHSDPVLDIYELMEKKNRSELASEIKKTGQRGLQVSKRPWARCQDGPSALTTAASRKLQALFKKVYGTPTKSNNNCWLRRKLLQGRYLQVKQATIHGLSLDRCLCLSVACVPRLFQGLQADELTDTQRLAPGSCLRSRSGRGGKQASAGN